MVASNLGGLHLVDVADPLIPRLVRTIPVTASQVEIADGTAYITAGSA